MSTLRTNVLETLDSVVTLPITDIARSSVLAAPGGADLIGYDGSTVADTLDAFAITQSDWLTTKTVGILSVEQGATDPNAEKTKWETLRVMAETNKSRVYIGPGTYVLPQGVRLDADNTVWEFSPGALLKLWDTQATDDFIIIQSPVNQRIRGLRFDANRAVQNSAIFGIDNCGCIIVDANNFLLERTHIVSSPAKGLALVSSAGGTNTNVTIRGVTGGNCNNQAVLIDGNNMTGFFKKIVLDDVQIGDTSHGGVVINDGVHDLQVSNISCDVNNTTWDAVAVRDCWDIQLDNVRGRRGRNGVQIQSLSTTCKRIQMDNIVGENSDQSGVLIFQVEDLTAGTVTGFNNTFAGINIAQTGGGVRCKNISIANPSCYDDRGGSAVQQYGLHIAGCDGAAIGRGRYHGNVTRDVRINRAVSTLIDVLVEQRLSITTGSIGATSVATVTVTWPQAFEDAEYDVDLVVEQASASLGLELHHLSGKVASQVTVVVRNAAAGALTGTLHAVARRRP